MVSKRLHFFLLNSFCSQSHIVCSYSNTKVRAAFRATKTQQLVITTRIFPWVFLLKTESSTHNTESFWSVRLSDIYSYLWNHTGRSAPSALCVQRRNSRGFQSRGPAGLPSRFPFQICVCNHKKDQPQIRIAFLGVFPTKTAGEFSGLTYTTTCNFQEFGMHSRMQIALVCQGPLQEICSSHHFNFTIIFFSM